MLLTDEGLDGIDLHVVNEASAPLRGELELEAWGRATAPVERVVVPVEVPAGGALRFGGDALIGHFSDLAWAYRFGPPRHDCVVGRLRLLDGAYLHDDVLFRPGTLLPSHEANVLTVSAEADGEGKRVTWSTSVMLQAVSLSAEGWLPDDNFFHLAPSCPRVVQFRPGPVAKPFRVEVSALNLHGEVSVRA